MKNFIGPFLLLFSIIFSVKTSAQQIGIPAGSIPVIDGVLAPGEWDDADFRLIEVMPSWEVKVLYKHSDTCLYFAFKDLISGYGQRYPDMLLDITRGKDTSWQPDDWWFHASYNDCHAKGTYNLWTSCKPSHPGWKANNFPMSAPGIIEMEISYALAGIPAKSTDTLGISFEVSDTYNDYHYYPYTATIGHPSTWTDGILLKSTSSIQTGQSVSVGVIPNPSTSRALINFSNPLNEKCSLTIFDHLGKVVYMENNITGSEIRINCDTWTSGFYFIRLNTGSGLSGYTGFAKE